MTERTTRKERENWRLQAGSKDSYETVSIRAHAVTRLLDDADAADTLRAQVAALQEERDQLEHRLNRATDIQTLRASLAATKAELAAAHVALAEQKKLSAAISRDCNDCANERNEARAELAAAQEKLAVPVDDAVQAVINDLQMTIKTFLAFRNPAHNEIIAGLIAARDALKALARDNAALRTKAEALERERDGLRKTLNETLDEWNKADNEHHRSLAEKL